MKESGDLLVHVLNKVGEDVEATRCLTRPQKQLSQDPRPKPRTVTRGCAPMSWKSYQYHRFEKKQILISRMRFIAKYNQWLHRQLKVFIVGSPNAPGSSVAVGQWGGLGKGEVDGSKPSKHFGLPPSVLRSKLG
eukprot:2529375-Pyramimonas_sp.AAC.1